MVLAALAGSFAIAAVNLPFRAGAGAGPGAGRLEPYMMLGETLGRMACLLLGAPLERLQIDAWGIEEAHRQPAALAVLKGALTAFMDEGVNYVNAEHVAETRGIEMIVASHSAHAEHAQLLGVTLSGGSRTVELGGTLVGGRDPRVVRFGGYHLEFRPQGRLLVLENRDVPGVVGKLGTLLGEAGVNIADIHLARLDGEEKALAVLRLDQPAGDEVVARLRALPEVLSASQVDLAR
jgi:D-3-phosphoglycerate dehydrogenase